MAPVGPGAQAPAVEPDVVTAVAVLPLAEAVVVAEPVPVLLDEEAVPVAEAAEPVEQLTTVGTATPWAEQIWVAKAMALVWSAWSQAPVRQQAMLERKDWFSQMHLGSVPQPA